MNAIDVISHINEIIHCNIANFEDMDFGLLEE